MKAALSRWLTISGLLAWALLMEGILARPARGQDAVQPTATLSLLPGGILPDSPLAQVIKLVQAGVDIAVIQNYITNSTSTFNLDADKIITLKDVGAPTDLATLMMQHDRLLQAQIAAATPPPVSPPSPPVAAATPPPIGPSGEALSADDTTATPIVTVNYFYDLLAAYGNWVVIGDYGRCWQPGVAVYQPDWQPYGDHGHWVYTDSGWYWVSDYSWGWVPFHYGRWVHDTQFGWCWCPDTVWGPSWVTWRWSDDYCGWAPLPPGSEYVDGSGFIYDGSIVAPDGDFGLVPDAYIFVAVADFCDPHPARHRIEPGRASTIYHQTTVFHQFDRDERLGFINRGIAPANISRVTHLAIRPLAIHETTGVVGLFGHGETVQGTAVVINRPQFRDNQANVAVAWNRNAPPAVHPQTPADLPGADRAPQADQGLYQEPARAPDPGQDQRPAGEGGFLLPNSPHYENNYPAPVHPEAPREPALPPGFRGEPFRLEPTAPREELKPPAEPAHSSPAPAAAKPSSESNSKSGGH